MYGNSLKISHFLLKSLSLAGGGIFAKYLPYALILSLQCLLNSGNELLCGHIYSVLKQMGFCLKGRSDFLESFCFSKRLKNCPCSY